MRRASSRERTSPTSRRSPSQIANSAIEADSGIGKKYVPSSVASVSFLKTCSTCVVATCALIFVSIFIDLIGSARGSVTGRGGTGQRVQGPGTMTPCALAVAVMSANRRSPKTRQSRSLKVRICLGSSKSSSQFPSRREGVNVLLRCRGASSLRTPRAPFLAPEQKRGGRCQKKTRSSSPTVREGASTYTVRHDGRHTPSLTVGPLSHLSRRERDAEPFSTQPA